jgi:transposase-like protein
VDLPISSIRLDGGTQPRAAIDHDAVGDYMEAMQAGAKFPSITVFYDGSEYWLADGFHRIKAAFAADRDEIACDVHQGTREDAQWFSFSANKSNGLRRTNDDKQRAVKAALAHPMSAGKSDHQIAKHVGVSPQTVGNWRASLSKLDSRNIPVSNVSNASPQKRLCADGRTMNVTNIGKGRREQEPPTSSPRASLAQSAERPNCDRRVSGSTPEAGSISESSTGITEDPLAAEWMKRIAAAALEITECEVTETDLAVYLKTHPKAGDAIRLLENANEFLVEIIGQAKRAIAAA